MCAILFLALLTKYNLACYPDYKIANTLIQDNADIYISLFKRPTKSDRQIFAGNIRK